MFPPQWSHDLLFYIGFNKENLKKKIVWNYKAYSLDIWYVASPQTIY